MDELKVEAAPIGDPDAAQARQIEDALTRLLIDRWGQRRELRTKAVAMALGGILANVASQECRQKPDLRSREVADRIGQQCMVSYGSALRHLLGEASLHR